MYFQNEAKVLISAVSSVVDRKFMPVHYFKMYANVCLCRCDDDDLTILSLRFRAILLQDDEMTENGTPWAMANGHLFNGESKNFAAQFFFKFKHFFKFAFEQPVVIRKESPTRSNSIFSIE